jgi:hypothetical protein
MDANDNSAANIETPGVTYFYRWGTFLNFDDVELASAADLALFLASIVSDAARVLMVCTTPGVELDNFDWNRDGNIVTFATTDPGVAKWLGFDEMSREDAEDFEPAPWAVQS